MSIKYLASICCFEIEFSFKNLDYAHAPSRSINPINHNNNNGN